jgi:hypothetical protein
VLPQSGLSFARPLVFETSRVFVQAVNVNSWQPKIPPYSLNLCLCDTDDLEIGAKTKETVAYPRPTPNSLEVAQHAAPVLTYHNSLRPFVGRVFAKELHIFHTSKDNPGYHAKLETLEFFIGSLSLGDPTK